jgi:hypothetical protein
VTNLAVSGRNARGDGELYGAIWCVGFALAWLLPTRTLPWTTFYAEALCAFVFLIAGAWALSLSPPAGGGRSRGIRWQWPVIVLLLIALVAGLQAITGLLALPTEVYWLLPALAAMAVIWLASGHAEMCAPGRLMDHVWSGLLLAATVSVGIALFQWSGGVGEHSFLVPGTGPGGRAEAHVGQSNNLATLLCWGLVAVWWHYERGRISAATALTLALYLVVGIAMTRSRTAWVSFGLLGFVLFMAYGRLRRSIPWIVPLLLVGWLATLWLLLPLLSQAMLGSATGLDTRVPLSVGPRAQIYAMAMEALRERPWFGWGWGQVAWAQVALAPQFPTYGGFASYAHSIVLDLLIWFGIPVGAGAIGLLAIWLVRTIWRAQQPEAWMLLAGLGVFGAHAMLELPHGYAYFYLPAALMAGTLGGMQTTANGPRIPRVALWCVWVVLALLLAAFVRDYRVIEEEHLSWRLYEVRIGRGDPPEPLDLLILDAIPEANQELRRRPVSNMPVGARDHWRRVVTRYPALGALARFAQGAALNEDPEGAQWSLSTICLLFDPAICDRVVSEFRAFEQSNGLTPLPLTVSKPQPPSERKADQL